MLKWCCLGAVNKQAGHDVKYTVTHSCNSSTLMIRIPRSRREKVRLAASTVLIVGIVLANQVHAKNFSSQPLTRMDCDKAEMAWDDNANVCIANSAGSRQPLTRLGCEMAGMAWNDNANVCGATSLAAEALPHSDTAKAMPKSQTTDSSSQPLTRNQCDKAGMRWNDNANVCGEKSGTQAATS